MRTPTKETNPIHNNVSENTTVFLLSNQPWGEANTTNTLTSKIDEVTINERLNDDLNFEVDVVLGDFVVRSWFFS